ncbi:hypothetical protein Ciccas_014113 [Cichlidogyrus casuarinus]|uniref:Uncharacterized protein n=1 Tax=Cichlidogyrus casuarinus TaxID=1844966 RepID=A0ABD2PLT7_9PLAT
MEVDKTNENLKSYDNETIDHYKERDFHGPINFGLVEQPQQRNSWHWGNARTSNTPTWDQNPRQIYPLDSTLAYAFEGFDNTLATTQYNWETNSSTVYSDPSNTKY